MQVNATSNYLYGEEPVRQVNNQLDKDAFLQLLVAQLKNQDPMSPQDSNQFINQMVQFTTLEQLTNMNQQLEALVRAAELTEGAALVGHQVSLAGEEGTIIQGTVEKVSLTGNKVYLYVDGKPYELSRLVEVR